MQDDLRSFARSNEQSKPEQKTEFNDNLKSQKSAQDLYEKYKNYSENDLIGEIAKLIINQKKAGTFNKSSLLNNINSLSSFIPPQKLSELKELIEHIDSQN